MCMVGKQVVLELDGTQYDGNRAMVLEQNEMGILKVQVLEKENLGQVLTVTHYHLKD